jgi:hypothetical protein
MAQGYNGKRWYASSTFAANAAGAAVQIPNDVTDVTVVMVPAGADTCRVDFTNDDPEVVAGILSGTPTWVPWSPALTATLTAAAMLGSITAVRGFSSGAGAGGTIKVSGRRTAGK